MRDSRNTDVLRHIISFCNDIFDAIQRFGDDYSILKQDSVTKNATALCVMQIGELTITRFGSFYKNPH